MPSRKINAGPATWTFVFLTSLVGGGVCFLHEARLDRDGRSVLAEGVEIGQTGKGRPVCDYSYVVDGRTYLNRNRCVGLPTALVDYLPSEPLESRLHAERDEGTAGTWGFAILAFVSIVGFAAALIENPTFWRL